MLNVESSSPKMSRFQRVKEHCTIFVNLMILTDVSTHNTLTWISYVTVPFLILHFLSWSIRIIHQFKFLIKVSIGLEWYIFNYCDYLFFLAVQGEFVLFIWSYKFVPLEWCSHIFYFILVFYENVPGLFYIYLI